MTKIEMLFKAREVWNDRDRLIDLREDWGKEHGCDETYCRMQTDINRMGDEAEALEQGIDPYVEGSDTSMDAQLSDAGMGSAGVM